MSFLTEATERESEQTAAPLTERKRVTHAGKVLAVAERADGALVLCREIERGKLGAADKDGKRKRSRDHGTEKVLKPTAALADFAHALEADLL